MAYIIIGIVFAIAALLLCWVRVKADQERARRGKPPKHDSQVFTVIGLRDRK